MNATATADNPEAVRVHMRFMIRRDMEEVVGIEADSFEFPWPEEEFLDHLRQHNGIIMVAEYEERIVGFMAYELHKTFLKIEDFVVRQEFRRKRVGRQMMDSLKVKLSVHRRRDRLRLSVRDSNLQAQLFFRAEGFRATAVLRDTYEDTDDDEYVFEYLKTAVKVTP